MQDLREWVDRLRAGEDAAWQQFVRTYSRFVPMVSLRLGLSDSEREEVLQEMTLTAYRSIGNLRDPERLASWTFTIARRAAILQLKNRRGQRLAEGEEAPEPDDFPSDDLPIDEILAGWQDGRTLHAAVARLNPGCRRLVDALFLEDPRLSYKEVSERYDMPMGSIGPTLARCLGTLRRLWKSVSGGGRGPSVGV